MYIANFEMLFKYDTWPVFPLQFKCIIVGGMLSLTWLTAVD